MLESIVGEAVKRYRARLYGYVLMSNHFHLLVEIDGGPKLCRFVRDIKSLSARRIFPGRGSVWERGFDDVTIFTETQFRRKLSYIHLNPVKAGMVGRAENYRFSSAACWMSGVKKSFIVTQFR